MPAFKKRIELEWAQDDFKKIFLLRPGARVKRHCRKTCQNQKYYLDRIPLHYNLSPCLRNGAALNTCPGWPFSNIAMVTVHDTSLNTKKKSSALYLKYGAFLVVDYFESVGTGCGDSLRRNFYFRSKRHIVSEHPALMRSSTQELAAPLRK